MSGRKQRVRLPKRYHRVRLKKKKEIWKPVWDPDIRTFALNFINQNRWRTEEINDVDDLMQDAYILFLKICDTYPRVVEPPHFMSLYKTSLRNMINDKARVLEKKLTSIGQPLDVEEHIQQIDQENQLTNYGTVSAILENGPEEVKMLWQILQDDQCLEELRKPQRTKKGEPRLNFDQRVSKFLGIDTYPFRQQLRELLSP